MIRNAFDRDPTGTYLKVMADIDKDVKNGYIYLREARRLRKAAAQLYLRGKKIKGEK